MTIHLETDIPGPRSRAVVERKQRVVPAALDLHVPVVIDHGHGASFTDLDGNVLLDFSGGLGPNLVGHSHPKVVEAVAEQVRRFSHTDFTVVPYEAWVDLSEALVARVGGDRKVALFNSGAEAVENAVKIARYTTGRQAVIGFTNGFAGRTLLGMTLTAKSMPYKHGFGPFAPEVYRVPFAYCYRCPFGLEHPSCGLACADYAADMIDSQIGAANVACIVVEPVQGEGGFVVAPDDYLLALRAICSERDILFVDDEVQAGMGRTGKLFAAEHYGVIPDIVTTAKSLGAGLPISAITGPSEVMDAPHVAGLGGTYGGNPVACAAALAVLGELTETDLLDRAQRQGSAIRKRLDPLADRLRIVGEVRGLGPMVGVELVTDKATKEPAKDAAAAVVSRCHANGVLILTAGTYGNVVRLLAPLVISDDDLDEGLDVLVSALEWADRI